MPSHQTGPQGQGPLRTRPATAPSAFLAPHLQTFRGILSPTQFVGINERAVQDPNYEESFFKTHLHGRIVERIQIYENAVVVEMVAPQPSQDQQAV